MLITVKVQQSIVYITRVHKIVRSKANLKKKLRFQLSLKTAVSVSWHCLEMYLIVFMFIFIFSEMVRKFWSRGKVCWTHLTVQMDIRQYVLCFLVA